MINTPWSCQKTLDQLIASGKIQDVVIIGVYSNSDRPNELPHSYDPERGVGGKGNFHYKYRATSFLISL